MDVDTIERRWTNLKKHYSERITETYIETPDWDEIHLRVRHLLLFDGPPQGSEEWLKLRNDEYWATASNAMVLTTGASPFISFQDLVYGIPPIDNDAMKYGRAHEKVAAEKYARLYKTALFGDFPLIPDPFIRHMGASPDRITWDGINVEIKCPYTATVPLFLDEEGVRVDFPYYWHQVQFQMHVMRLDKSHLVLMDRDYRIIVVEIMKDETWWTQAERNIRYFIDIKEQQKMSFFETTI